MLSQLMPILIITFSVFVLFFLFMGVGYIFKKQPLKGSCGGVANLMGDEYCQFCGNDPNKCESLNADSNVLSAKEKAEQAQKAHSLGKSVM